MSPQASSASKDALKAAASISTLAVHSDDGISAHRAVAPAIHVSTTFRYGSDPKDSTQWTSIDPSAPHDSHVYSRDSHPNTTRLEAVLSSILNGPAVTYASGLAGFHAMMILLNPKRIAITDGYHGCHGVIELLGRLTGLKTVPLDCDDAELQPGDVIHVETPLNPLGEARSLAYYAAKAKRTGAYLTVDATFAPPPLQDPFRYNADLVMHSGTKYIGGHSDLLCGVVAVNPKHASASIPAAENWEARLRDDRMVTGSVLGSLEGWLGLRSVRTLELRVLRQSATATQLVQWLATAAADAASPVNKVVQRVHHASLQTGPENSWLVEQMPNGFGPVFAVICKDEKLARTLPSKLAFFQHATSLGGVESLVEWRSMSDEHAPPTLLRFSIGVEAFEDLKADLLQGFEAMIAELL
ncbi:putative trans-sulfuration enzyme YHR112C [Ceratocystis fimbriata CBS 114723]|uniref:Putative trans-sulfuration enzyme YHR112C n=1 Tax=Ceratocystis fimbriata CBS 114723 TaxID=1035309 RepID=A0A2C5X978_9PEZI|nr:putative trans-sulfuration enzyme YHR112C [Ceratocystis fimbriata CBS 114723]